AGQIMFTNLPGGIAGATLSGSGGNNLANAFGGINMLFVMRVSNSGAPTTAWNWRAYVVLPGGGVMDAQIPSVMGLPQTPLVTAFGPYTPKLEDHLIGALSSSPLPSGGGKEGWIVVHVDNLSRVQNGTHFVITFEDVYGRETKVDHLWAQGY
ncbi:MAG TPA: hypothetical protein VMA13_10005, partial [Candidatus Saccharimonadales bacterium]|nr:hypothetical protein [Candidatus Saccharimonadales bacterium]